MAERKHDEREALFHDMMQRFDEIRARYRGVRGELLEKVRDELMTFDPSGSPRPANDQQQPKATPAAALVAAPSPMPAPVAIHTQTAPTPAPAPVAAAPTPAPAPVNKVVSLGTMKPSCRFCGRAMNQRDDGALVCQNGHVRLMAS